MPLSSHDFRLVINSISILNSDHFPETLPRRTFDSVKCLIPTDVISYEAFGSDIHYQGPLWFEPLENVTAQMLDNMREYVSDHPLVKSEGLGIPGSGRAIRLSEVVTLPQFKRTVIYNEFFKLLGTNRQLSAGLHISPELMVSCSLCRLGKDYSDRDASVLDLLTPHLIAAFRNTHITKQLLKSSDELADLLLTSERVARISLNEFLEPMEESTNARTLLDRYFSSRRQALPGEVLDYLKYNRRVFLNGSFFLPSKPLKKVSSTGSLVIRVLFQTLSRTSLLVIEERSNEISPNGRSLGLTDREAQVLYWVSFGKTDKEIAILLNISFRTVHKHIENIFTKLGVETRTAAASFIRN